MFLPLDRVHLSTPGQQVTVVAWSSRIQPGESLSSSRAHRLLWDLVRAGERRRLVEIYHLGGGPGVVDLSRVSNAVLIDTIVRAVDSGRLLFLSGRDPAPVGGLAVTTSVESRLARQIMAGRAQVDVEGHGYRLLPAASWSDLADRDRYRVLSIEDARSVLGRMATRTPAHEMAAIEQASTLIVDRAARGTGLLLLLRLPPPRATTGPLEHAVTPSQLARPRKAAFGLVLLDAASGAPVDGVPLRIITPEGTEQHVRTDGAGRVRIPDLTPGDCQVASVIDGARLPEAYTVGARRAHPPPQAASPRSRPGAVVVNTTEHRVKTGETPESIAETCGVPWEVIARFNWGTAAPDDLQAHYRDTLGCTTRSADGKRYVFDDRDDPGVLLVPRPWEATFAVGPTHEVGLVPLRTLYISLRTELGLPVPGARYEVALADGSERSGVLGRSGIARLVGVPEGPFSVAYADEIDVLAASLAASVRRGFDEQVAGPVLHLLMQTPEVVARAQGAYDRYFNDLTGQGLWADADQVVTDPDARRPLLALCALNGLTIDGVATVTIAGAEQGGP